MGMAKPVDISHLDRYTGGEREITEQVLKLFMSSSTDAMARFEAMLAEHAGALPKDWRETAHTLKGASRGIGAFALAEAAQAAESSGSDRLKAIETLADMKERCAAVHAYINDYLNGRG
jgi:HPt (histidine-containing phosphotransfer) domain-containing protein